MASLNLSAYALKHQSLVCFFMILFFIAGLFSYHQLSKKEEPELNWRIMIVQAYWPGATAIEMEQQVLKRLEHHLQEVPHLSTLDGYAKSGEIVLRVELEERLSKQEIDNAWYQVRKKISDMKNELPPELIGPFFNDEFGDVFGLIYALKGYGFSYAQLKKYAEVIRDDFLRVPNVNKVSIIGDQPQKIYIEFSYQKLSTLGISPQIIIDSINDQNALEPPGILRNNNNETVLRLTGIFGSINSIKNTNIHTTQGDFRVGDIANVYRSYQDPPSFKMHFQGSDVVGLAVSMNTSGNILTLGKAIDTTIDQLQLKLPLGLKLEKVADQAEVVHKAIDGFMHSLVEAVVIVMIISFFALGLRCGIVVSLSIPLVLAITFTIMWLMGMDLQIVSLGSLIIAIGLLVDDAMISIEMMLRKLEEGFDKVYAATFAYTSTAFPMLTGTLITIAGFLPISIAKSDAGSYTFSIFSVVAISLLTSWFVSVFFIPYLGYKILKQPKQIHTERYHTPFYKWIREIIELCMIHNKLVIGITIAILLLCLYGFTFLSHNLFPASNRSEVIIDLWMPDGTPFQQTEDEVSHLEQLLAKDTSIINYASYIGGSAPRFYVPLKIEQNEVNYAQMVILTKDDNARDQLIDKLNQVFSNAFLNIRSVKVAILEPNPQIGYPIQFRILGDDIPTLHKIADDVTHIIQQNNYTVHVNQDGNSIYSEQLIIDADKARALNISTKNLAINIRTILNGLTITKYREGDELIDIEARSNYEERNKLSGLKNISIYLNNGNYIPLDQIAVFKPSIEEGNIAHYNGKRAITIRSDVVKGAQALDVTEQIKKQLQNILSNLPQGYSIEIAGLSKANVDSQKSVIVIVPLALIVMLIILMFQLNNFSQVLLVFLTAPLGIVGITIALLVTRLPFGFVAMLGTLSLSGMIMRNSVILINQIERNIEENISAWESIVKAMVERLRPILLTACAAIFAMIPLLFNLFWGPMAVSIMGGLFFATILTILYLPALYVCYFKIKKQNT